jgi:hypothetical protein
VERSPYQVEQHQGQIAVRRHLEGLGAADKADLSAQCAEYLAFRKRLDHFHRRHLNRICTPACFTSGTSACCQRDAIITFFADVVVNALVSEPLALNHLMEPLERAHDGPKCVYLGASGCLWKVKPIVCAMFLCDRAEMGVLGEGVEARDQWRQLQKEDRGFRWPDRPVLFDAIEERFMAAGIRSSLMYLHLSPGLLRIKRQAGWSQTL